MDLHFRPTKFDDREVGDGTALQRQGRVGNETYLGTDSTKRVSLGVDQITEVIYDGLNLQGNADLNLRILPQFELDLLPTWQWTYGEPRFAEDGAGPNQLLFGKLDAKALGITLRTTYTFAPRLTPRRPTPSYSAQPRAITPNSHSSSRPLGPVRRYAFRT